MQSFVVLLVQSFFLLRIFKRTLLLLISDECLINAHSFIEVSNSNWTYVIACSSVMTANFICAMIFTIRS